MDQTERAGLLAWLDRAGVIAGPSIEVSAIATGRSNITYLVGDERRRVVVRRPATVALDRADEGMRREFRLLSALEGTPVPHPSPIALCDDRDVLGCVFYAMSYVDGFLPTEPLPSEWATPESRRAMSFSAVDAMAALHAVDWRQRGLEDLGRVEGFHKRQRTRWLTQYYAYPSQLLPGIDDVGSWLESNPPGEWNAAIMHGDVNGNNMLIAREHPPVVAALLDWETATIGDPLLDLGHLLATWPTRGSGVAAGLGTLNLPTTDEVVSRYATGSSRDLSAVGWYHVLACYRLGIILEGTNARADAGQAPRETGDLLHAHTVSLFEQALELISG